MDPRSPANRGRAPHPHPRTNRGRGRGRGPGCPRPAFSCTSVSSFAPSRHRRFALCLSPKLQASTTRRITKCPRRNDATEDEVLHEATRIRSPSRPGSVSPRAASLLSSASARRLPRGRKGFLLGFPEASKGGRCCPVSASNGPVDVAATHSRGLRPGKLQRPVPACITHTRKRLKVTACRQAWDAARRELLHIPIELGIVDYIGTPSVFEHAEELLS